MKKFLLSLLKGLLKFVVGVAGLVLTIALVVVFLPRVTEWAHDLPFFEREEVAYTESAILARHMRQSARLETSQVDDEGVMESTVKALFLGPVQTTTVRYQYKASLGIDLNKVEIDVDRKVITMKLPPLEVLADSLTVLDIKQDDFLLPMKEEELQELLAGEQEKCREHYLQENEESEQAWQNTLAAMENTIGPWITWDDPNIQLKFVRAEE